MSEPAWVALGASVDASAFDAKVDEDAIVVAGTRLVASKLGASDTQPAFRIMGDGKHEWGPGGSVAPDTSLSRTSPRNLKANGSLQLDENLVVGLTSTPPVIFFGTDLDTNLYRTIANVLKTDDSFAIGGELVTSLPASPVDGQYAVLTDSLTNPNYIWRFRYRGGSSSTLKWEFVGGAPLASGVTAQESGTSQTAADTTTVHGITIPRTGDYFVQIYANVWTTGTACIAILGPQGAGIGTGDNWAWSSITGGAISAASHGDRINNLQAGGLLKLQYRVNAAGATMIWNNRRMHITPIRVS